MRVIRFTIVLIAGGWIILLGAAVLAYVQQERRIVNQQEATAAIITFADKKFHAERGSINTKLDPVTVNRLNHDLDTARNKNAEAK